MYPHEFVYIHCRHCELMYPHEFIYIHCRHCELKYPHEFVYIHCRHCEAAKRLAVAIQLLTLDIAYYIDPLFKAGRKIQKSEKLDCRG